MAKLCMGCMNPLPEGTTVCAVCGFDLAKEQNPEHCLPITTALQGHYIVGRCLGAYSDHLLYLAYDRQLREPCFIQEFYPDGLCHRDTIGGVQPNEGCDQVFENFADWFRNNMRTLARLRELPALVPVYDIFEENGTVYAASDYCQGMTLTKKIKLSGGRLSWSEARPLFMPLLSTLAQLNEAGIYHMAVCPDNIVIGADGKARLRNFSLPASHQAGTNLKPMLQPGFAAPEQYQADVPMGDYTDVYGIAATLFRTVTGNELPAGDNRAKNSDDLFMSAEVAQELSQPVCAALFNALLVPTENRTAKVAVLRDQLSTTPNVAALVNEAEQDMGMKEEDEEPADHRLRNMLIVFGICLAVMLLVGVILYFVFGDVLGGDDDDKEGQGGTTPSSSWMTPAGVDASLLPSGWNDPASPNYIPQYNPNSPSYDPTYVYTTSPYGNEEIEAPNLIGVNYYDLSGSENLQVTLKLVEMREDESDPGIILEQDPVPGTRIQAGSEIRLVISGKLDDVVKVPNVAGWKENQAIDLLEAYGFKVEVEEVQSTAYDKGYVVGTDPKSGTEKRKGDTITLLVSATVTTTTTTTTSSSTTSTTESTTTTSSSTVPSTEPTSGTETSAEPTSGTETIIEPTEPTQVEAEG
ncbi:MAG: PASTA domain-containing protein [Ruminococcaceae bacterium]|nr:PASTA domain-containing protein [Oscillospiraceae bacterium]